MGNQQAAENQIIRVGCHNWVALRDAGAIGAPYPQSLEGPVRASHYFERELIAVTLKESSSLVFGLYGYR